MTLASSELKHGMLITLSKGHSSLPSVELTPICTFAQTEFFNYSLSKLAGLFSPSEKELSNFLSLGIRESSSRTSLVLGTFK